MMSISCFFLKSEWFRDAELCNLLAVDKHSGAKCAGTCVSCADLIGPASINQPQRHLSAAAAANCCQSGQILTRFSIAAVSLPACDYNVVLQPVSSSEDAYKHQRKCNPHFHTGWLVYELRLLLCVCGEGTWTA